ncbi:hypothetical protein Pcinc_041002 [Petrolisthes cinctipes]|uniref:Uncharacterized protein n=1 Tax=Petrolisthes cinctipes TaxID=88211 RepID=A0AAE1BKF0_PETCI|nr:hypothetical protein Pcinc_041002 [Petrolisthes cinctipes]
MNEGRNDEQKDRMKDERKDRKKDEQKDRMKDERKDRMKDERKDRMKDERKDRMKDERKDRKKDERKDRRIYTKAIQLHNFRRTDRGRREGVLAFKPCCHRIVPSGQSHPPVQPAT